MEEAWVCIVTLKGDGTEYRQVPSGGDIPMRRAIEYALTSMGLEAKEISSAWGFPPDKVGELNHAWADIQSHHPYEPPPPPPVEPVLPTVEDEIEKVLKAMGLR